MSSPILPTSSRSLRPELPRHIGIINDYLKIPYANGSSFASQFLYREFARRGLDITVLGPRDPNAREADLPRNAVQFDSLPLHNHPGLFLALPSPDALSRALSAELDVVLAQTGSGLLELGVWLRATAGVPLLCVNTIHLPSVYNVLLPDSLHGRAEVTELFESELIPRIEALTVNSYNQSDGLIVLSQGLERYWRERGVRVPIHVIPRAVDPSVFDAPAVRDPFAANARPGQRLLCVCRHTREKSVDRLIRIFAQRIAGRFPESSLTLVGDGPDHDSYRALARSLGLGDRVHFPGEYALGQVAEFYRYADLFVYASLSETYGQVVSEAAWCGLPVVAFDDAMGVSHQVESGKNGYLIAPGPDPERSDQRFAEVVGELLSNPEQRAAFGERARRMARDRSDPELSVTRYFAAFLSAREHCARNFRPGGVSSRAAPLARWAAFHALLAGLGRVRPPAVLNRHGRKQPGWDRESFPLNAVTRPELLLEASAA
ncbi:MAG TPA: glycosyltransferase [Polyangiaceae bacterium]|nr:glycosyltransferase [Polyangiaceae bacterium]